MQHEQTLNELVIRRSKQLRSFCRGEMSAAEAYTAALMHPALAPFSAVLRGCQLAHARRAELLKQRLRGLGEPPPKTSGAWGAIVELIEEAAADLGVAPALAALEEGERHGLRDYYIGLGCLDPDTLAFVQRELVPGQAATKKQVAELRASLA